MPSLAPEGFLNGANAVAGLACEIACRAAGHEAGRIEQGAFRRSGHHRHDKALMRLRSGATPPHAGALYACGYSCAIEHRAGDS